MHCTDSVFVWTSSCFYLLLCTLCILCVYCILFYAAAAAAAASIDLRNELTAAVLKSPSTILSLSVLSIISFLFAASEYNPRPLARVELIRQRYSKSHAGRAGQCGYPVHGGGLVRYCRLDSCSTGRLCIATDLCDNAIPLLFFIMHDLNAQSTGDTPP